MFKVRFNLGAGENFGKWAINKNGETTYVQTDKTLLMFGCTLKNYKGRAEKIFKGAHKDVCAWVSCENINITEENPTFSAFEIFYNPRVLPYWHSEKKTDLDNQEFSIIFSVGKRLFVPIKGL